MSVSVSVSITVSNHERNVIKIKILSDTAGLEEILDPCEKPIETTSEASGEDKNDEQRSPRDAKQDGVEEKHTLDSEELDKEEMIDLKQDVEEPRRKRGAALKITSFKELSLNS